MKTNIAVFFGCRSVEHEASIISAVQAMRAVDRGKYDVTPVYVTKDGEMYTGDALFTIENYRDLPALLRECEPVLFARRDGGVWMIYENNRVFSKKKPVKTDIAFPIVHGTNCEDGTAAGYFEYLGLPYIGCDILSSAVGMDKAVFKDVLKSAGLPVLDCVVFRARDYSDNRDAVISEISEKIGFPLIIKPVNLGSSVGITKVNSADDLDVAIALAASFTGRILAERAVTSLREINCSVLGDADRCEASVCEEPFMHDEILSYEDKYLSNSKGGASKEIKKLACDVFRAVGASGVVRIDFLMDTETGKVYANEINTIPGSLAFYLWEASGLKYTDMIDRLADIAFKRQRERENLTFTIDTNILSGVSFGAKGAKGAKL